MEDSIKPKYQYSLETTKTSSTNRKTRSKTKNADTSKSARKVSSKSEKANNTTSQKPTPQSKTVSKARASKTTIQNAPKTNRKPATRKYERVKLEQNKRNITTNDITYLKDVLNKNERKRGIKRRFFRFLPFILAILFIILFQLFYPNNTFLPFSKISNDDFGLKNIDEVLSSITDFESKSQINIVNDDGSEQLSFTLSEMAVKFNLDNIKSRLNSYPLYERLIPFSIFKNYFNNDLKYQIVFPDGSEEYILKPAVDASIINNADATEVVSPDSIGYFANRSDFIRKMQEINFSLSQKSYNISLSISEIKPKVSTEELEHRVQVDKFNGSWTSLSDLLRKQYENKKGFSMVVIDLGNKGRDLQINENNIQLAASTYKLFAAYSMFKNSVSSGIPDCLEDMIVLSQNYCPENYMISYGWHRMNEDASRIGSYVNSNQEGTYTNAGSLANFLKKLYYNQLDINANQRELLLSYMKRQVYRDGIPNGVGVKGQVADKVGFLPELSIFNDAAIVYSDLPNNDYIEVIMTENMSFYEISQIAKKVHDKFTDY